MSGFFSKQNVRDPRSQDPEFFGTLITWIENISVNFFTACIFLGKKSSYLLDQSQPVSRNWLICRGPGAQRGVHTHQCCVWVSCGGHQAWLWGRVCHHPQPGAVHRQEPWLAGSYHALRGPGRRVYQGGDQGLTGQPTGTESSLVWMAGGSSPPSCCSTSSSTQVLVSTFPPSYFSTSSSTQVLVSTFPPSCFSTSSSTHILLLTFPPSCFSTSSSTQVCAHRRGQVASLHKRSPLDSLLWWMVNVPGKACCGTQAVPSQNMLQEKHS